MDLKKDKFRLLLFFSAQLFSQSGRELWPAIQALCAFATAPGLKHVRPKPLGSHPPTRALRFLQDELSAVVTSRKTKRVEEPKATPFQKRGAEMESLKICDPCEEHQDRLAESFIGELMAQWPCQIPQIPDTDDLFTYFDDLPDLCERITNLFGTHWGHRCFMAYMDRVMYVVEKLPIVEMAQPADSGARFLVNAMKSKRELSCMD